MLPETLCTSPKSAHLCIHREHDDSQRDLENFARLANFRGPSQKGDSVCMLTLPFSKALMKAPSRGKMRLLARHVDMRRKGGIVGAALLRLKRLVDCGQL